jgi:hypothetical protein
MAVNTTTGLGQSDADVTLLPGGFVITWASDAQDGSGAGIYARRYQAPAPAGGLRVVSSAFDYASRPQRITFTIADDVSPASLAGTFASVSPANGSGGAAAAQFALSGYDAATRTATFTGGGVLPDGNYHATLSTSGATTTGAAGLLAAEASLDFFVLVGDVDRDRTVGPGDFNMVASHFGQSGQTWATGDLDGDGNVGPADFNLLASRFGTTLAAPLPAAASVVLTLQAPVTPTKRSTSVRWSASPITAGPQSAGGVTRMKARR